MIRVATIAAVVLVLVLAMSHRWAWITGQEFGRQAVQLELQAARAALEVEYYRQAQISRAAAIELRTAEAARDRAIR